jgi:uncharacterized repeat protein (TIGR03803 family)
VFSINTNGAVTAPLVSFSPIDGFSPRAALVQGTDGYFYGTTPFGGDYFSGNVFRMSSSGALTNLYSFSQNFDGANPYAPLLQAKDGNLYGCTTLGGTNNYGTVFRINSNGAFTALFSFTTAGSAPTAGLIQGSDGRIYGVTSGGGSLQKGNVFRLAPNGQPTDFYSFLGGADGSMPNAVIDGTVPYLYGTTTHSFNGGIPTYGTIFGMTMTGTRGVLATLYSFKSNDGYYPFAGLVLANDGNFYGTTHDGGTSGNGIIFRIAPNGIFTNLASFDGHNDGAHPAAALVQGSDDALYGTTTAGGVGGQGTVFRLAYTSGPQIITQPADQTVSIGGAATFSVTVAGASPLSYQWQRNGTNIIDGISISGATARILNLTNITVANAGTYSIKVSNALGTATNAGAVLTVRFPPSFQTVIKSNNSFVLSWTAAQGQKYQLQYKTGFNSTMWLNVGPAILASGGIVSTSDSINSNSQRFYRVVLLP